MEAWKLPEPFATDARMATLGRETLDTANFLEDIIKVVEPKRDHFDSEFFELVHERWHERAIELRAFLEGEIADMYQTFVSAEAEYAELEQLWKKWLALV